MEQGQPSGKSEQALETAVLRSSEGALKKSGSSKEESEARSQEGTRNQGVLKELQTSGTSNAAEVGPELGEEQSTNTLNTESVQDSQPQTTDSAATLKVSIWYV